MTATHTQQLDHPVRVTPTTRREYWYRVRNLLANHGPTSTPEQVREAKLEIAEELGFRDYKHLLDWHTERELWR